MRQTIPAIAAATLAAGASVSAAHAAGFALVDQSAMYEGAAFAGATARADDPSTLFYNPAGMAKLPGYQVSLSGAFVDPSATLVSGSASHGALLGGAPIAGTVGQDAARSAVVPSFYATAQIAPDWHVGISVTSPYGLTTKYDTTSIARYYALTTQLREVNVAPAVAWQVLPTLSLGAALQIQTAGAHLSNSVDFGSIGYLSGLGPFGFRPGSADGIATVKGDDTALGWQLGALWEPAQGTRVGLDYRSAVFHTLSGSVTYSGVPTPLQAAFANSTATAKLPEPDNVSLGVAQDIGRWTLLADLKWTHWARFKQLMAEFGNGGSSLTQENWRDTWTVSMGADYRVTDKLTLRAGTAWDQTPVTDADRTPRIPDSSRYWLSAGATWKPIDHLALSIAYAHLFANDPKVNQVDQGPGTPNFLRGNLLAAYEANVNIVAVQATLAF